MTKKTMTLYGLSSCSHCKDMRSFLLERNVHFKWICVDWLTGDERSRVMRELKQANPTVSFPTLVSGKRVIVGFKPNDIEQMLNDS